MTKNLVAYFSASGITAGVAKKLSEAVNGDLYEIKPVEPYTGEDLNWMDKQSRSSREMNDKSYRPEIVDEDAHVEKYDVIFLGFPVWWYVAPTIVNTFLEKYDFSGKTIVLFITSGGSGFGNTAAELAVSVDKSAKIIEGKRFNYKTSVEELKEWAKDLDI